MTKFEMEGEGFTLRLPSRWPSRISLFGFARGSFYGSAALGRLPEIDSGSSSLNELFVLSIQKISAPDRSDSRFLINIDTVILVDSHVLFLIGWSSLLFKAA
jgi:hypothetical protein